MRCRPDPLVMHVVDRILGEYSVKHGRRVHNAPA
jgi:hypothetical protein